MSQAEIAYLVLVLFAFTGFGLGLAFCAHRQTLARRATKSREFLPAGQLHA